MTTTHANPPVGVARSRVGEAIRALVRRSGPILRPLAGRRFFTIWAVIRYRGRRSGTDYAIPIAIARRGDAFIIPMPFTGAQWVLNVLAAGECVIRWNGSDWHAVAPEVIEGAEGASAFGPIPRLALGILPIHRFLRLRQESAPDMK
jgi:hypothetical protein